jgi:predicted transcriptional regulator
MKSISIQIDEKLLEKLDFIAESYGKSRSEVVRNALADFAEYEEYTCREVMAGLEEVERGEFATEEEVEEVFGKRTVHVG